MKDSSYAVRVDANFPTKTDTNESKGKTSHELSSYESNNPSRKKS